MEHWKRYTDFLVSVGVNDVPHTGKSFLAHLVAVAKDLEDWGCDEAVCIAGLFHSIYGTQRFRQFGLPLERRGELQALVGPRAEMLAYINCAMDRPSFDANLTGQGPYAVKDRYTEATIELDEQQFIDLCQVQLCDWLEQVPRSQDWDYRRDAYRRMAERLGGVAQEAHREVYGREAAGSSTG